jgi:L,D-transpeptidase YcbB
MSSSGHFYMKYRFSSTCLTALSTCFAALFMMSSVFLACNDVKKPPEKDIVKQPEQLQEHNRQNIQTLLAYAGENNARINDSITLHSLSLLHAVYDKNNFETVWSREDHWQPLADSLFDFVEHAKEYGLFPADYYYYSLTDIRNAIAQDTLSRKDAALWTRADVMLTDAYFKLAKHLKLGRLERDSATLRADSLFNDQYFLGFFTRTLTIKTVKPVLEELEPAYIGYRQVKAGIKNFLDSAYLVNYTYVTPPSKDTLLFLQTIRKRLMEEGFAKPDTTVHDSLALAIAIRSYQQANGLKETGKPNATVIRYLNDHDWEKFKKIAVTLDRYKLLPDTNFSTYAMVNIPSYTLFVYDEDTLAMQSRVIVGAPKTKTPLLYSEISNFITYPQWTVPYSIIFKEMLPKIQRDINFLQRQNLMVVDKADSVIDPLTIDWRKLSKKNFPYLLRQRQGDDNSLGVIKFNFRNKYSVYLHDTNARWLFSKSERALSHGCVRVKEWEKLSRFLVRNDTLALPSDTLKAWIIRQEKHVVSRFPKLPLFIRYFTVEGKDEGLRFYDDIYGQDRVLIDRYFANKAIS